MRLLLISCLLFVASMAQTDSLPLENLGNSGCTPDSPCGRCQGDCDSDDDCEGNLSCYQRTSSSQEVPGCLSGGSGDVADHDYCYQMPLENLGNSGCTSDSPCGRCQGDCDTDDDCEGSLSCYQRTSSSQEVPGCLSGGSGDVSDHDYCYQMKLITDASLQTSDDCLYVHYANTDDLDNEFGFVRRSVRDHVNCDSPKYIESGNFPREDYRGKVECLLLHDWLGEWNQRSQVVITVTYRKLNGEEVIDEYTYIPDGGHVCNNCRMERVCETCEVTGFETSYGVMSLEECESRCLERSDCVGIDYGKDNRDGRCFLNFDEPFSTASYDNYDAYKKECVTCAEGYTLVTRFGENQICDSQADWVLDIGGPNWPAYNSDIAYVSDECANECNIRANLGWDCNYYIWASDRRCRLQSDCASTVNAYYSSTSLICEKNSAAPTSEPSPSPTRRPTHGPSPSPTSGPTSHPTTQPSPSPTSSPTGEPSPSPTDSPTSQPSPSPTDSPTVEPSLQPSPTRPSACPSKEPSPSPTPEPTHSPTFGPTSSPTDSPSAAPSVKPTELPSRTPTKQPSKSPTHPPTPSPTQAPSHSPTTIPTESPTTAPTENPSAEPSKSPSLSPTLSVETRLSLLEDMMLSANSQLSALTERMGEAESNVNHIDDGLNTIATCATSYEPIDKTTVKPTFFPSVSPSSVPSIRPSMSPSDSTPCEDDPEWSNNRGLTCTDMYQSYVNLDRVCTTKALLTNCCSSCAMLQMRTTAAVEDFDLCPEGMMYNPEAYFLPVGASEGGEALCENAARACARDSECQTSFFATTDCCYRDTGHCAAITNPCECVGECGWSTQNDVCGSGSEYRTTCTECDTLEEGCITGSCLTLTVDLCPSEYNEMRICQCNDQCRDFGNCCWDVTGCQGDNYERVGVDLKCDDGDSRTFKLDFTSVENCARRCGADGNCDHFATDLHRFCIGCVGMPTDEGIGFHAYRMTTRRRRLSLEDEIIELRKLNEKLIKMNQELREDLMKSEMR